MVTKTLLFERIAREQAYLSKQEIGTEEYVASTNRLNTLLDKLADLEKFEVETERKDEQAKAEKKDKVIGYVLEGAKIVGGIFVTAAGLIYITANEKEITYTGEARNFIKTFLPKKLF